MENREYIVLKKAPVETTADGTSVRMSEINVPEYTVCIKKSNGFSELNANSLILSFYTLKHFSGTNT